MHIRTLTKKRQPKTAGIETVLDLVQQVLSILSQGFDVITSAKDLTAEE